MKRRDQMIHAIMEELTAEKRGGLPAVRSPQRQLTKRAVERQGFFARLFDPYRGLEMQHALERLKTELETETELLKLDAQAAVEKKRIQIEAATKDYQDKAERWREMSRLENAGMAELVKHQKFQELVNLAADLGLDPLQQELLLAKLHQIFLAKEEADEDAL